MSKIRVISFVAIAFILGIFLGSSFHAYAQPAPPPPPLPGGPGGPLAGPGPEPADPNAPQVDLKTGDAALKTAQDSVAILAAGNVWTRTGPAGDQHVEAAILLKNQVVARLHFDPADGTLLPVGYEPRHASTTATSTTSTSDAPGATKARQSLAELVHGLQVLPAVAVAGREGFWRVSLAANNRIVADLMVSGDGTNVIEDFGTAREAAIYAR